MPVNVGCDGIPGCTYNTACNYEEDAQYNDGSCWYPAYCEDCFGNCLDTPECYRDDCGVCGGGNNCCDKPIDCAGVCEGDSYMNPCDVCVTTATDFCVEGCDGVWKDDGTQAIIDSCGHCVSGNDICIPDSLYVGCHQCCGGTYVCSPSDCGDEVVDDCGVCGGDNSSCEASVLVNTFHMILWQGGGGSAGIYPSYNNLQFNCIGENCQEFNIDALQSISIPIQVSAHGEGLDLDEQYPYSDLDIQIKFDIYINRKVTIGAVQGTCDDIHQGEASVLFRGSELSSTDSWFSLIDGNYPQEPSASTGMLLPEIDLFGGNVEIGGTNYVLDNNTDFEALYGMELYIKEIWIQGYPEGGATLLHASTNTITFPDINNKKEFEFNIIHRPLDEYEEYDVCPGLPGDASGVGGVTCYDWYLASLWYHPHPPNNECYNYLENQSAPSRCCNVAMLQAPINQLTSQDLNYLLEMIASASGENCLEP